MSHTDDTNKEKIWKYCKKIASFSHALIKLKDYQRMLPFSEDVESVDVIMKALEEKTGIRSLMGRIKWSRWKDIITP